MRRVASHGSHLRMTELAAEWTQSSASHVSGYAVLSTEDDESAGGYFVTGTMKDFVPTW